MQSEIFVPKWFHHFLLPTKPTAEDPVMLIFDGHATHTNNITLIEMARENDVHILVIPPHTSHRLQPFDVSFMGPLNSYYEQAVRVWLEGCYMEVLLTITRLLRFSELPTREPQHHQQPSVVFIKPEYIRLTSIYFRITFLPHQKQPKTCTSSWTSAFNIGRFLTNSIRHGTTRAAPTVIIPPAP